jgi:tetratricopeptide (TPR) repeat protein
MAGRSVGRSPRGVPINPEALRQARLDAGLTQAALAEGIMTKQALCLLETGRNRPTRAHLLELAERLGTPLQRLLANSRDPREQEMATLSERRQFDELEALARRVLADKNVTGSTRAVAMYHLGRSLVDRAPEQAARELRAAQLRLSRLGLRSLAAEAMDWEAIALYYLQDAGALDLGRNALTRYRALADRNPTIESRMLEHIGTILLQRSQYEEAIDSYHRAMEAAGSLLDLARLANINHGLAESCRRAGRVHQGLDYMERAIVLYRTENEVRGAVTANLARAENDYGYQLMRVGRFERAEEMMRAAIQHYEEAGIDASRPSALLSMGELRQLQGRLDEATDVTCEAIELAERLEAPISIAEGYQQLGELWSLQGEWDRFEAAFSRAIEVLSSADLGEARTEALARYRHLREPRITVGPVEQIAN